MMHHSLSAAALSLALSAGVAAQDVGSFLSEVELENFSQTGAASYGELLGRAVLIEFFAYW